MTDFAYGVEQNRVAIRGDRSQVEKDVPFLNTGHDRWIACRRALASSVSESRSVGNGGETATTDARYRV